MKKRHINNFDSYIKESKQQTYLQRKGITLVSNIKDEKSDDIYDAIMMNDPLPKGYKAELLEVEYSTVMGYVVCITEITTTGGEVYRITIPDHDDNKKVGEYNVK